MPLPDVTVTGEYLSDLFFNHGHPKYDGCFNKATVYETPRPSEKQIRTAILADASEFINHGGLQGQVTAEELVDDFLKRL